MGIARWPVHAATYYVSTSGNDGAPGTVTSPFATVQRALDIASAGDIIILRGGVHAGGVRIRTPRLTLQSHVGEWARLAAPIDQEETDTCVYIDLDASGTTLRRLEISGGYFYGVKTESNWDWGEATRYGASNILLEQCRIHDTGRDCIKIVPASDNVVIRNCEIYNSGRRDNSNAEGIDNVNGDYMTVENCYIHDTGTTGVYAKGGAIGAVIQGCLIMNCGALGVAIGFDTSPEWFDTTVNPGYYESINAIARNCIIINTTYAGIGIYAAKNPHIYNNTIIHSAQNGQAAIHFGAAFHDWEPGVPCPGSVNPVLRNNLIIHSASSETPIVQIRYSSEHIGVSGVNGALTMSNNRYFKIQNAALFQDQRPGSIFLGNLTGWKNHISGDANSSEGDPKLNANYHLQANSPCINAGFYLPGASGAPVDYDGGTRSASWDIGADEYATGTELKIPPPASTIGTGATPGHNPSTLTLNPTKLNFGAVPGLTPGTGSVRITFSGTGNFNWQASANTPWLSVSPASGSGAASLSVSVSSAKLAAGTYSGQITLSSPQAANSPQSITVTLRIYKSGALPFGEFSTPAETGVYRSSIPVTGWALDDVEITAVRIYLIQSGSRRYIGDAALVEGARPDVAAAYPDYPFNHRAGWGYMLLSYFLPGSGNGPCTLEAVAEDRDRHQTSLGRKTIQTDNAHAVNPFGAIDSPSQGGTASGSKYLHGGWTLTPPPHSIPKSGAITLYIDGVNSGNIIYGLRRRDIEALFPGYRNQSAAGAYYFLDTTRWADGLHTIAWSVTDSAGHTDGVGSRYFSINNGAVSKNTSPLKNPHSANTTRPVLRNKPASASEIIVYKGFDGALTSLTIPLNQKSPQSIPLPLSPQERIVVCLGNPVRLISPELPAGASLDQENGVFYWLPGPGFSGKFPLTFELSPDTSFQHNPPQNLIITLDFSIPGKLR